MTYSEDREAIERLAVTRFLNRCTTHAGFLSAPEVVMQIIYDEMFSPRPRVKRTDRPEIGKGR